MTKQKEPQADPEATKITEALLARAEAGKHSAFTFIRSYKECQAAKVYRDSTIHVCKNFKGLSKSIYKTYLDLIAKGGDNLELILTYKNLEQVIQFYTEEAAITKDILIEYNCYILSGHIIDTLLGKYRPDTDLIDVRTLPKSWW